jgi:hypothetical protein
MPLWNVYQPIISDERSREVNLKGWSYADWCSHYNRATNYMWDARDAWKHVRNCLEDDLYSHSYIVECDDVEQTFDITNGMADADKTKWRNVKVKSGSVGDVVIKSDHSEGWICLSVGWAQMSDDAIHEFESKVATCMMLSGPRLVYPEKQ